MIRSHKIYLAFSSDDWDNVKEVELLCDTHTGETLKTLSIIPRTGEWLHLHRNDLPLVKDITTNEFFKVGLIVHRIVHISLITTIYLEPL
jgi:hypothetical protein